MVPDSDKAMTHSSVVNNLRLIISMSAHSSVGWDIDGPHLRRLPQLQRQRPALAVDLAVVFDFLKHSILLFLHCGIVVVCFLVRKKFIQRNRKLLDNMLTYVSVMVVAPDVRSNDLYSLAHCDDCLVVQVRDVHCSMATHAVQTTKQMR